MRSFGMLGPIVARSEIDNFVQKDSKQTITQLLSPKTEHTPFRF